MCGICSDSGDFWNYCNKTWVLKGELAYQENITLKARLTQFTCIMHCDFYDKCD